MPEDLSFLWITELVFSCVTTVSENCFTSVLHGVDHLLAPMNRYSRPGWLNYTSQFLCISWFYLRKPEETLYRLSVESRFQDWADWVFAILAFLPSMRMVVFCFLSLLSGSGSHFKVFEIILAKQTHFLHFFVFPSPVNFLIKVCCSSELCLERPIYLWFSERNALQPACTTFASFILKWGSPVWHHFIFLSAQN